MFEVRNLTITVGQRRVVDNVSFDLHPGKVLALVGESGSGKTLTALALLNLLPIGVVRERGEVMFDGKNIFNLDHKELRSIRGNDIAMVFQEPFTALNPVMRVGSQIRETIIAHKKWPHRQVAEHVKKLLDMVKLSQRITSNYPHELSGGMRQRVVLAMALSCEASVLILDEPTTALDVSIQKEILGLIKDIQEDRKLAILFITHDFSVVNMIADEVCVMRQGVIVEKAVRKEILQNPQNAYTRQLIDCIPRLGDKRNRLSV